MHRGREVRNWWQNLRDIILLWMPCPHHWDTTPQWWCCCWVTGPSHLIDLPEHLHHASHGAKACPAWSRWCTRKEDEERLGIQNHQSACLAEHLEDDPKTCFSKDRNHQVHQQGVPYALSTDPSTDFSLQVHIKNEDPQDEKDSERNHLQKK